jgi:class 3 adenylate cyclase
VEDVPQTRWARTVDGACIAYQDLGEGPVTLLVVHGWVSHLEVYWEQPRYARFVRRLSRNMRVLLFDKRGVGMSDRVAGALDLGVLADDVRAVLDDAGVERAAILGYGWPGPDQAAYFAAAHPDRVLCLITDGYLHMRREADYPFGMTEQQQEDELSWMVAGWGTEEAAAEFVRIGFGRSDSPPYDQPEFRSWCAKLMRFAATPASYETFERVWFSTDVRPLLGSISVPTAVLLSADMSQEDDAWARLDAGLIPTAHLIPVEKPSEIVWVPEPEAVIEAVERFVAAARHEEAALDRVLATVLFTDIVGSTDRASESGDARWKELLERHDKVTRGLLARYRGTEVKSTGDGVLATFDGPARAVKCAQAICEAVRPLGLEVRAGCHTGEIELMGADVGGIAVHIGARVAALAGPSEVLVSSTVKDLVAGSGLVFSDRGEHALKGVPEKWRLYAVAG